MFYLPYAAPTKITYNTMPRTPNFNSAREDCARKTAKSKVRGGGGKFAKRDSMDCTNVIANPITNAGVRKCSEPDLGVHFADPMEDERVDESQCYFCGSAEDCDLCMQTHYNLCAKCRNSNPTQGWWEDSSKQINSATNGFSGDGSIGDDDVFHPAGSAIQDTFTGTDVLEKLMSNGSRMKPANVCNT